MNRYTLVVKNLSAATADVTWGKTTKTFAKAELEAGVNLAEAFPENPFSEPFSLLDRAVGDKQNRETRAVERRALNLELYSLACSVARERTAGSERGVVPAGSPELAEEPTSRI